MEREGGREGEGREKGKKSGRGKRDGTYNIYDQRSMKLLSC